MKDRDRNRSRMIAFSKDTPDDIFIDVDSKRFADLLRDPLAAVVWVTPLHLNDG